VGEGKYQQSWTYKLMHTHQYKRCQSKKLAKKNRPGQKGGESREITKHKSDGTHREARPSLRAA